VHDRFATLASEEAGSRDERTIVNLFRRLSTPRLLLLLTTVAAAIAGATLVAVTATGGAGAAPAGEPLPQAVHDALAAPPPQGVDARVTFTNNLLPSSSLLGNVTSALVSGASGRLWLTNDGRGRIELQSDAGDTQIVWNASKLTVYDSSANTAYEVALPPNGTRDTGSQTAPSLDEISSAIAKLERHANISDALPGVVATQSAYTVFVSPSANGGLFGDAQLAWASANGVPLRIAITAKGGSSPVLELKVTDITFGSVDQADVAIAPPAGTKIVELAPPAGSSSGEAKDTPVTGVDAVRAAVPFSLAAPAAVGGRPLTSARLVGKGALLTYGEGLGSLVVHESASSEGGLSGPLGSLPKVSIGALAARELATPLGTLLTFDRDGIAFVVGGSMTTADAEAAARAFA
jgi:outer membrane lipoprotein-sorting protein